MAQALYVVFFVGQANTENTGITTFNRKLENKITCQQLYFQLDMAKKYIEYHTTTFGYKKPNVNFVKGFIEKITDAGLSEDFFDIVM